MKTKDDHFRRMLKKSVVNVVEKDFIETEQAAEHYEYPFKKDFEDILKRSSLSSDYGLNDFPENISLHEKKWRRIPRRQVVVITILLTLLLGTTLVLANSSLREGFRNFIISTFHNHIQITESDRAVESEDVPIGIINLKNAPKEYMLIDTTDELPVLYDEIYRDKNQNVLIWGIHGKNANMDLNITADGTEPQQIRWKGHDLWVVSDGEYQTVLYEDDVAIYSLQGCIEVDALCSMVVNTLNL